MNKRIVILGSTGSIGTQALEVAAWLGYDVVGLAASTNADLLIEQVRTFRPAVVSCDASVAQAVRATLPTETKLVADAAEVALTEADTVVAAISGFAGLASTLAALRQGRHVALANKEAMVVAGPLVWEVARAHGARLTPVDSELSALYQCLQGEPAEGIEALVLTASGGPFRLGPADLTAVTPEQALKHPNWAMGSKITIDSATLFNKGLKVLESPLLLRAAALADRSRDPSAVIGSQSRALSGWQLQGADRLARYAPADPGRAHCAGAPSDAA